ncbi:hypothetical protein [Geothrix sp. PMB-07]|uniref:hypothetical protein n=1 Tax=Geothrix sp. PMB-07 TaxID=3068640 RepID=UPI0027425923|nr:hypothetical protein [Geothrix sp. PMB-07]WLT33547.1 hypothetical protein Q9293_09460 [Geothrix sp. PMB-07]
MRHLLLLPALLLTLACSSKLDKSRAEDLLRKDYPVVVTTTVPEHASAEKGSPEHLRLTALREGVAKTGWFDIEVKPEGNRETFTFRLKPDAPKAIKAAPKGFSMPAAEAVFVRAAKMEPTREGARVTYEVRLEKPTAQFPLFQAQFPNARLGQIHPRFATFERRRGAWELTGTSETFRKAE